MKLYNANLSPNALRVRAVVNELGIALEVIDVDLRSGGNRTKEFLALNPNGKVPVLVDGDFVLWESRAINAYLATMKPESGLYPADLRKRAMVDQWSYWQAVHFGPAMHARRVRGAAQVALRQGRARREGDRSSLNEIAQLLPILDANLAGKDWIAGALSLADFAVGSTLVYAKSARISLADTPNVSAWIERLEARPSWQAATAPVVAFLSS